MQNMLKFIESANWADLYIIKNAIDKRTKELDVQANSLRVEMEDKERTTQWNIWKERAQSLVDCGNNRYDAVKQSFYTLSNLWICRDHESTCLQCGEERDEYYEFLFRYYIQVCSECTEVVDLTDVFDVMREEIHESKRIRCGE